MEEISLTNLAAEISILKKKLAVQENQIIKLEKQLKMKHPIPGLPFLIFSLGLLLGVFVIPYREVQSKIIINPPGYNNQFGLLALPQGSTFSDSPVVTDAKFGIVASGNPTLSLATLPIVDTGAYATGSGYGVYATSSNSFGYGLYAYNTATSGAGSAYGVYGRSVKGVGIAGESAGTNTAGLYGLATSGPGVMGTSNTGTGVLASSGNGVPLTIIAGPTPISGTRQMGDMYVDTNGRIYIWAKDDALVTSNWRKLQFGT